MRLSEFVKCPEVIAMIEEIVKHDVNNSIVSIGLADYHLNENREIITGDGGFDLYIFYKKGDADELLCFISDYDYENRGLKNQFCLCEEIETDIWSDDGRTPCHTIYTPSGLLFPLI